MKNELKVAHLLPGSYFGNEEYFLNEVQNTGKREFSLISCNKDTVVIELDKTFISNPCFLQDLIVKGKK